MSEASKELMMLGLHRLAAGRGDGLVPELLALYAARETQAADIPTPSGPEAAGELQSTSIAGNDNVILFRPYLIARQQR